MTGPEHYREAERILVAHPIVEDGEGAEMTAVYTMALTHATLALAAATALSRYSPETGFVPADGRAWYAAASEGPGEKQRQREAEAAEFAAQYGEQVTAS